LKIAERSLDTTISIRVSGDRMKRLIQRLIETYERQLKNQGLKLWRETQLNPLLGSIKQLCEFSFTVEQLCEMKYSLTTQTETIRQQLEIQKKHKEMIERALGIDKDSIMTLGQEGIDDMLSGAEKLLENINGILAAIETAELVGIIEKEK